MKISKRIIIAFIALFFMCSKTIVQGQSLKVENSTVSIDNVSILDSILPGNSGVAKDQMLHRVDFEIFVRSGDEFLKAITELQSSLISNKLLRAEFNLPVSNGGIAMAANGRVNKRIYKNALVKKIVLQELNASSRNNAKIIVTIEAASIEVQENASPDLPEKNMKAALLSNYRLKLGSLPCDRIARITEIQIGSQPGLPTVTVQLSGADEKGWNEQFGNGSNKIITDGTVELLSADLKTVLLSFNLKNITIVSYKTKISTSEQSAKASFEMKIGSALIETKAGK